MEYAAIFLPLIGSILGYFSKYIGNVFPLLITTLFVLISSVLSILIFYNGAIYNNYENHLVFEWISSGNFVSNWSINIDPLSSIMLVVVSFISFLVHLYSIGYMKHDPNKPRLCRIYPFLHFQCWYWLFQIIFYSFILDGKE